MKNIFIVIVFALLALSACANAGPENSAARQNNIRNQNDISQKATPPAGIVYAQGTQFMISGKPFYFAGCNAYSIFTSGQNWMTNSASDIENYAIGKTNIDTYMSNMAAVGVKVLRTWGFDHEAWMGFEPAKGVYCEPQFMKFDYILQSAKNYGIKVIIVLENYWNAYGGIDTRLQWEGLPYGDSASRVTFFTNAACQLQYKNYVQHFVGRTNHYTLQPYMNDPAIFSWELMNEPRCQDGDTTGSILRPWVDNMGLFIKSIDPNHMVSTGMEGQQTKYGYGGDSGNPFVYIHQSPYVDFCTAHPYPDEGWAGLSVTQAAALVDAWIADAHNVVGKPFVMEEFNTHNNKEAYWTAMYGEIESKNAGGDCFWNFNLQNTSDFDMLPGNSILSTIFLTHANNMAAKSGPVSSASASASLSASSASIASSSSSSVILSSSAASSIPVSSAVSSAVSSQSNNPGTLRVQTYQSGSVLQNQISEKISLINSGTSPVALSTVKIRYYITYQGSKSYTFNCDYSPVGSANVTGIFAALSPVQTGAEAYNEISFTAAAGSIAPGASIELQCRMWKSDWSNIDNSLNYSYNPATAYIDWNKVTAYQNGVLSFGIEPGGSASSASSLTSSSSTPISSSSSSVVSSSANSSSSAAISSSSVSSSVSSSGSSSSTGQYADKTAPFTFDGAGEYYWRISSIPNYMNCWNLTALEINGISFLNTYAAASALPAEQNGYYYIHYKGAYSYSHFEAK